MSRATDKPTIPAQSPLTRAQKCRATRRANEAATQELNEKAPAYAKRRETEDRTHLMYLMNELGASLGLEGYTAAPTRQELRGLPIVDLAAWRRAGA